MADSVNRIVPPSVALDRAAQVDREAKRKKSGEARKKARSERVNAVTSREIDPSKDDVMEAEEEKTKGKNLDVNA
jgi:hypothetical protein